LNSYNGFTPHFRMQAYRWLMAEYAAGRRGRPVVCDACGQTEGLIEAHSEDYSAPYGDHIGQHGLCWTCHMIVHTRFRNPAACEAYRAAVREGAIFQPFPGKAFHVFAGRFLGGVLPEPWRHRAPIGPTVLDQIAAASP